MALRATDIDRAVSVIDADPGTSVSAEDLNAALRLALPLLQMLLADIPWWRKLIIGVGVLIDSISEYLEDAD